MKARVMGALESAAGRPVVRLVARARGPGVVLGIERESRRAAKSDHAVALSAHQARELMRQLQAAADQADRQAYAEAKAEAATEDVSAAVEFLEGS